ncbi:unnamed protein product [Lactuca saligna]|uniref:Uncharacterized protein n=1 Tax=Lactuca saligna TaxID=75948 RepID=A0AA35Y8Q1_LACSI|nr:unnamed protein product [Lactuca saligna]
MDTDLLVQLWFPVIRQEILGFFEATSTQQLVSGEGIAGKALGTNQQLADMSNNVVGLSTIDSTMVYFTTQSLWIFKCHRENETPSHYGTVLNVHQQQMSQGDGYGSSTTDSSRTGNFYVPTTSNTSMMNNQSSSQSSCISFHINCAKYREAYSTRIVASV